MNDDNLGGIYQNASTFSDQVGGHIVGLRAVYAAGQADTTAPDIDGLTPDEAYAKLVDNCPPDQIAHRHEYALNYLVKWAQEIGYADGIAAGQPKQLPTTPGSSIWWAIPGVEPAAMILDNDGYWGNYTNSASAEDIRDHWTLIFDAGQEQNA